MTGDQLSVVLGFISIAVSVASMLVALGVAIKVGWWDRRSRGSSGGSDD